MHRIESLLSARLFLAPQTVGDRLYFLSNLSGHLSLYVMDYGGSIPEPLIPPQIALQNPALMGSASFKVFPRLGKILVMIDDNGDEVYQPNLVPIGGGYPEPLFAGPFANHRVYLIEADADATIAYFLASSQKEPISRAYRANLETGELLLLGESMYGGYPTASNSTHTKFLLLEVYRRGDHVAYYKEAGQQGQELLYGVPMSERQPDQKIPPNSISAGFFVNDDSALLIYTSLFSDTYGLALMNLDNLDNPGHPQTVAITGIVHQGTGELDMFDHVRDDRYLIGYNIDGCSWLYEGFFEPTTITVQLDKVICGQGELSDGVVKGLSYDKTDDRYALSFATATSPTQIYTIEGLHRSKCVLHTQERILGIPDGILSPGEDASFTSYDGLRISARLYLPHESLASEELPLVYYIHGGPQSQEHPDFAWFSMPLIQILTLNGFAVFVPNVRGSTGYGFDYMKRVEKDWGGADRLDHIHAMTEVLPKDPRIDVSRAGVVGRSYGGYMTLMLTGRHPEFWSAACDMFGPYDLLTFADRVPETWKPYIALNVGDPIEDRDFLVERSPRTYLHQLACPLLVIQGKTTRAWSSKNPMNWLRNCGGWAKRLIT